MSDQWAPVDARQDRPTEQTPHFEIEKSYRSAGAHVAIGVDSTGPIGGKNFVQISGSEYSLTRHFYFETAERERMTSFIERIIHDRTFRSRSLTGTADWKQVADIYDEASQRIEIVFEEHGLFKHRLTQTDETESYHRAKDRLYALCEDVYDEIDRQVRSETLIDGLDTYIDASLDRAREEAAAILDKEAESPPR